jgi:hypothetical protein
MGCNKLEAFEMVRIGMGEDKIVHLPDLFLPQERSDDILSDVETIVVKTPSVNEHPLPSRKLDKDRIAMSDIDKGHCQVLLKETFQVPIGNVKDEKGPKPK